MRWINVLHFYQPPLSQPEFVLEAAHLSYQRVAKALLEAPSAKVTVNFSGCLLEQLLELGQKDLIADWQKLVARGQVELLGSAYWHALLPKTGLAELTRQVEAQEKILARVFKVSRPQGFFAPELAYSPELAEWLVKRGYQYAVVDEISIDGRLDTPKELFYQDRLSGLILAVRQRELSKKYPPEHLINCLPDCSQNLFTATDGELYGLRHHDYRGNLEKCWQDERIDSVTVGQALAAGGVNQIAELQAASWESLPAELTKKRPYLIWDNRDNDLQQILWSLADLAQKAISHFSGDDNQVWMLRHLHQGLASCAWWWASKRDFILFSGAAWGPEEIIRGAEQLTKSIRSIYNPDSRPWKQQADKMFCSLQAKVWQQHWRQWLTK